MKIKQYIWWIPKTAFCWLKDSAWCWYSECCRVECSVTHHCLLWSSEILCHVLSCLQIIKRSQVKVLWQHFHFLSYIQSMRVFLICYFSLHMFSYNFCLMPTCHLYAVKVHANLFDLCFYVFLDLSRKIHLNSSIIEVRDSKSSCTST